MWARWDGSIEGCPWLARDGTGEVRRGDDAGLGLDVNSVDAGTTRELGHPSSISRLQSPATGRRGHGLVGQLPSLRVAADVRVKDKVGEAKRSERPADLRVTLRDVGVMPQNDVDPKRRQRICRGPPRVAHHCRVFSPRVDRNNEDVNKRSERRDRSHGSGVQECGSPPIPLSLSDAGLDITERKDPDLHPAHLYHDAILTTKLWFRRGVEPDRGDFVFLERCEGEFDADGACVVDVVGRKECLPWANRTTAREPVSPCCVAQPPSVWAS